MPIQPPLRNAPIVRSNGETAYLTEVGYVHEREAQRTLRNALRKHYVGQNTQTFPTRWTHLIGTRFLRVVSGRFRMYKIAVVSNYPLLAEQVQTVKSYVNGVLYALRRPFARRGDNLRLIAKTIKRAGRAGATGKVCREAIARRNGFTGKISSGYASSYFSNYASHKKCVGKLWRKAKNGRWFLLPLGRALLAA